jgi:Xaa-Pro dipeptidase
VIARATAQAGSLIQTQGRRSAAPIGATLRSSYTSSQHTGGMDMAQATHVARPRLSLDERDRRYARLRAELRERGVDATVVVGSNLFYLSNGLSGERVGLFPTADEPLLVVINGRHLADVPVSVLLEAQDWVTDIRGGNDLAPLIDRLRELRLERGTLGLANRDMPLAGYQQLRRELPEARLVDVSDVFANVRTLKSDEEVALIEQANRAFDAGIRRMQERVRPGMTGAEAVREGIQGMWSAGADLESSLGFSFGPVPKQNPILARLCLSRRIARGDIGTLTAHAHYAGYGGHSDQELSFGEPRPLHRELFRAVLHVRDAVLAAVKPGVTQHELIETYRAATKETGFRTSPHAQIHQYGIDVPEFPGPAFGGRGDFELASGMIYSISPTLVAPDGDDTLLGGTSLVVTEGGYRELGERQVELLVVS